jgi:Domain of unknown function (DUF4190)
VSDQGGQEGISWQKPNPQAQAPDYFGQPGAEFSAPSPQPPYPPAAPYGGPQYGAPPPQYGAQKGIPDPYGYQPQWGQQPQWGPGGFAPASRGTNGMAIASMVLGILWIYWIGSVLALIFGYIAKSQIRARQENGGGMATAGLVLGWIGVGFFVIAIIVGVAARTS